MCQATVLGSRITAEGDTQWQTLAGSPSSGLTGDLEAGMLPTNADADQVQ